jgi:hypothetical protein
MQDRNQSTNSNDQNNEGEGGKSEPRKYAGKYDTVEDLEKAYTNIRQTHSENEKLKSELDKYRSVPDEYTVPDGIVIQGDDLNAIKTIAKNAALPQEAFEKIATQMSERAKSSIERYESRKKELGEEKVNVLVDFVKKQYPANIQEVILNKCIEDNEAMTQLMQQRDKLLNSKAPGIDSGNTGGGSDKQRGYDGQKEVNDLAKEYLKTNDPRLRDKLINTAREVGHERFKHGNS